jgi:glycine/D-amino acid oxidase-like deaminating enzyme
MPTNVLISRPHAYLAGSHITKRQACNLPLGPDSLPIIGPVPSVDGAYVVGVHLCYCWQ